jgi:hypothetical protein
LVDLPQQLPRSKQGSQSRIECNPVSSFFSPPSFPAAISGKNKPFIFQKIVRDVPVQKVKQKT